MLLLTLALAASQVFATALDTYFQLTIMLMILTVGVTAFAHFQPFTDDLLQRMQVNAAFWFAHGTESVACESSVLGCIGEWTTIVCHEMPISVSMLCKMCRTQGWLFLISTCVASLVLVPKTITTKVLPCVAKQSACILAALPDSIVSSAEPCSPTMCYLAGSGAVHCADHRCRLPLLPGSYQHCQQYRAGSRRHNTTGPQCSLCGGDAYHDCSLWRRLNQAFHTGSFCSAENIFNKAQALSVGFEQFWCWCVCLKKPGHHRQHAKPEEVAHR